MVKLPQVDPTLEAADAALESASRNDKARGYLGMSAIGHPCARKLWYQFHWCATPAFDAATLKRFADGHAGEDVQAERLRLAGVELLTIDPETGQQWALVDLGGHFRGHTDGLITGLLQAPKTRHVWEHKQVSDKKLAQLKKLKAERGEKAALEAWDEIYFAQALAYMHYTGLTRHYLTAASPGGRHTISVRTNADADKARAIIDKARDIIEAAEPPARLSDKPEYYICKWCDFSAICHGDQLPQVNCRTCCHSTPELDGSATWSCARFGGDAVPVDFQRAGCADHVYQPALVSYAKPGTSGDNCIEYTMPDGRKFTNGTKPARPTYPHYDSAELVNLQPALIADAFLEAARTTFDARVGTDCPTGDPAVPFNDELPF